MLDSKGVTLNNSPADGVRAASKDAKTYNDMRVVTVFAKNAFDEIWVYLQPYMGHDVAHIRTFTLGEDGEMHPTKKGVSVDRQISAEAGRGGRCLGRSSGGSDIMTKASTAHELSSTRELAVAEPVRASQLEVRPVQWLWPGRVPTGRIDRPGWRAGSWQVAPQPLAGLAPLSGWARGESRPRRSC